MAPSLDLSIIDKLNVQCEFSDSSDGESIWLPFDLINETEGQVNVADSTSLLDESFDDIGNYSILSMLNYEFMGESIAIKDPATGSATLEVAYIMNILLQPVIICKILLMVNILLLPVINYKKLWMVNILQLPVVLCKKLLIVIILLLPVVILPLPVIICKKLLMLTLPVPICKLIMNILPATTPSTLQEVTDAEHPTTTGSALQEGTDSDCPAYGSTLQKVTDGEHPATTGKVLAICLFSAETLALSLKRCDIHRSGNCYHSI